MADREDYSIYDREPLAPDTPVPMKIVSPADQLRKLLSEVGSIRAGKMANDRFRERYVNKNREYNSMVDLSEGRLVQDSYRGFIPGKVYTYDYNPKWRDRYEYFDRRPLLLSMGSVGEGSSRLEMGINLHFLPPDAIKAVMELTWRVFNLRLVQNFENLMREDYKQNSLPLYRSAKKLYEQIGNTDWKFALRFYLPNRVKDLQIVEYTDWKYIPLLETKWIMGASKQDIWNYYVLDKQERKEREGKKNKKK